MDRAFTVAAGYAPNAIRLAQSCPAPEALAGGLAVLGQLASSDEAFQDCEEHDRVRDGRVWRTA